MKDLGNQGTSVHHMKTCTNLTGTQTHLPFHKEVHFYSICQLLGCHNLKPKDWYSALSWHSCHWHHLLCLAPLFELPDSKPNHEENQGQSRWELPSPHNAGSQLRGMSRILQCSYRKPWWEPDCRFNVKLNNRKKNHWNFLLNYLLVTCKKTKTNHRSTTVDYISALCCFLLFPEQKDVFLYPHPLNFHIYVKNTKLILPIVPDTICKITELAEDLAQLHYSVKDTILKNRVFNLNYPKGKRWRVSNSD